MMMMMGIIHKMPLQRKENDKHKEEDDDVPEEINEEIPEDIIV